MSSITSSAQAWATESGDYQRDEAARESKRPRMGRPAVILASLLSVGALACGPTPSPTGAGGSAGAPPSDGGGGVGSVVCNAPGTASAQLSNGNVLMSVTVASFGNSGALCGNVTPTATGFEWSVPRSQITFAPNPFIADLFLPIPAQIRALEDARGIATREGDSYRLSLDMKAEVEVEFFGRCVVGPLDLRFTTGQSGSLTGVPLQPGADGRLQGKLVAGGITTPPTPITQECNPATVAIIDANLLLGAGAGTASFDMVATLH